MKPIPSEWLQPGAIIPVTPEVVRELLNAVRVAYRCGQEAEREACAKLCEELELKSAEGEWGTYVAGWSDGTDDCAAAIRARGRDA